MKISSRLQIAVCCLIPFALLGIGGAQQSHGAKMSKMKPMPYSKIAPLIKAQCEFCHNASRHPEKVDLSSYKALMKGGENGAVVVAGHPEKSSLILYVDGTKQPRMPIAKPPLSTAEIALLKKWVASGAKG